MLAAWSRQGRWVTVYFWPFVCVCVGLGDRVANKSIGCTYYHVDVKSLFLDLLQF